MGFYVGHPTDNFVDGLAYFSGYGSGISSFDGGGGFDTIDFTNLETGWIWFEPMLVAGLTVQDPTTTSFFSLEEHRNLYLLAQFFNVERIIAGSGDDIVYLPNQAMIFEAGPGNDTFLYADWGDSGFAEGMVFYGGTGTDTLDLSADTWVPGYEIDLLMNYATRIGWPGEATMAIYEIEEAVGSAGNDTLRPGWYTLVLDGSDGNDTIDVNGHFLISGATYLGGNGRDTLDFSQEGGDFLADLTLGWFEKAAVPTPLYAYLSGIEIVLAGSGDDTLIGSVAANTLAGGAGDDVLKGRAGNDRMFGGDDNDWVIGNVGRDTLFGGDGNDVLLGQFGNDFLRGGDGADTLMGGAHTDWLNGGLGNDILVGQGGADKFVFFANHGQDVIRDFEVNRPNEVINLRALSAFDDFADVVAHATDLRWGVKIQTGAESAIYLKGVFLDDLSASDFLFA